MAGISPTVRTLEYYRNQGMIVEMVEKWIIMPKHPAGGVRKDYLSIIDMIAISKEAGIIGIQSTGSAFSEHYKKITIEHRNNATAWLNAGGKLVLISWRKIKKVRGGKLLIWSPRIQPITLEDLN